MRICSILLVLLIVPAVFACTGGGKDLTDREISDAMLAAMVLPKEELGDEYQDFELDDEAGYDSNEEEIEDATDKDDERQDIARFGRINGYDESYTSFDALFAAEGVFVVGTEVNLYETAEGASGDLSDQVEDIERDIGTTDEGVTLKEFDTFEVEQIADEAVGMTFVLAFEGGDVTQIDGRATAIVLRRGRLIGYVAIFRLDDQDVQDEVTALARKLDERMQQVLRDEIEVPGTPTAQATEEPEDTPTAGDNAPSNVLDSFRFTGETSVALAEGSVEIAVEGEFQAPDRMSCSIDGSVGGISYSQEIVVACDDAWSDEGSGFERFSAQDPEILDDIDLCPGSPLFWADWDIIGESAPFTGAAEQRNGVAALRYSLSDVADALGSLGFLPPELEGTTIETYDVWLAEDGGWPVAVDVQMTISAEGLGATFPITIEPGETAAITVRADITDVNDPSITVEPPLL